MKNKKGFTLIEIIGAVIILGIIAIIAFNTFLGNLKGFRDDYYNNIVRTLSESGKEFFNDNRNYRPNGILGAQKVSIGMLESKGYLDEVVDYKGKTCDKSNSYVLVVKEGRDDYSYHTCLKCLEDDFDNTSDMYCDPAWLDPNSISYGIGEPPEIYVYLGISREELKAKVEIPVSYVRKNSEGEVIRSVRGTPEEGLPTILPDNIDLVDTNKAGVYQVTYSFKPVNSAGVASVTEISPGTITVYENASPGLAIIYRDIVAQSGATLASIKGGSTETQTGIYLSDTWHQSITVTLTATAFVEPDVEVARYQWNKDGRWQDFCSTGGTCQVTLSKDMNETIQFRTVDTNGHISRLTNPVIIKRDDTSPYCEIKDGGTKGDDDWYIDDVDIEFTDNRDLNSGTYAAAVSGIGLNNLETSTTTIDRSTSKTENTHTENTTSVTYIGYAEDRAGNYTTCDVTFKKDSLVPDVSITAKRKGNNATVATDTWVNDGLNFTLTKTVSGVSGYTIYYCKDTNNTCTPTTSVTSGTSIEAYNTVVGIYYIRYKIVSGAGLESEVGSFKAKVDITAPTCSLSITAGTPGTSPWYTSSSMTVTATFDDEGGSLVNQTGTIDSSTVTYNSLTTYTLSTNYDGKVVYCYISDVAGNTYSTSKTIYKDDVTPTVSIEAKRKGNSATVPTNTWVNDGLNFTLTAGTSNVSGTTIYYCKDTANSCNPSTTVSSGTSITTYNTTVGEYYIRYKIVSGAGLESDVGSYHAKVDVTNPSCTMSVTSGTTGTSPWYTSSSMTVTAVFNDEGGSIVSSKGTTDSSTVTYNSSDTYTLSTNYDGKVVYCYVQDGAGNTYSTSKTIYKDDLKPTVSISAKKKTALTAVSSNTWSNQGLNFTLTAGTSNVSGTTIKYCKDTANSCSPSTTVSSGSSITSYNTTEGEYYIRYKIISGAGLESDVGSYHAKVDTVKPTCDLSVTSGTLGNNSWYTSNVTLTATFDDDESGVRDKGVEGPENYDMENYNGYTTYTVSTDGSDHGIYCYVMDNAGNEYQKVVVIKRDATAPTCISQGNSQWTKSDVEVKWGCEDSTSLCKDATVGTRYWIGSETYSAKDNNQIAVGWHYEVYNIEDKAGNTTSCDYGTDPIPVYFDSKPPICELSAEINSSNEIIVTMTGSDDGVGPASISITGSGLDITGTCEDDKDCSTDGHNAAGSLGTGNRSYTGTLTDHLGNSGTCSLSIHIQMQQKIKTCSAYNSCPNSACGTYACNCTTTTSCEYSGRCQCMTGGIITGEEPCNEYIYNMGCDAYCVKQQGSGSTAQTDTCRKNCTDNTTCTSTCNNTCPTAGCGCATWGNYPSSWTDVNNCSPSSSNSQIKICNAVCTGCS